MDSDHSWKTTNLAPQKSWWFVKTLPARSLIHTQWRNRSCTQTNVCNQTTPSRKRLRQRNKIERKLFAFFLLNLRKLFQNSFKCLDLSGRKHKNGVHRHCDITNQLLTNTVFQQVTRIDLWKNFWGRFCLKQKQKHLNNSKQSLIHGQHSLRKHCHIVCQAGQFETSVPSCHLQQAFLNEKHQNKQSHIFPNQKISSPFPI